MRGNDGYRAFVSELLRFVDFPYGTMTSAGKAYKAAKLVENGVEEVDLMPNVGFLLSGMERQYADDMRGVGRAAEKIPAKIMLELALLNAEKEQAVALSIDGGVTIGGTPVVEPWEWRHRSRSGFYERLHHRTPGFVGSSLASQRGAINDTGSLPIRRFDGLARI